jgi:hypothetical protein
MHIHRLPVTYGATSTFIVIYIYIYIYIYILYIKYYRYVINISVLKK